MKNPCVTVIIPVYNVAPYLRECVDSVIAQTFKDLEVILVDDGSTDDSSVICDDYAEKYLFIQVIHKSNKGLSDTRNVGLDHARGEFVMFLDSDDKILPGMIQTLLDHYRKTKADVIGCNMLALGRKRKIRSLLKTRFYSSREAVIAFLSWEIDGSSCAKLYTRSVIGSLRFPVGRVNEDFVFLMDLYARIGSLYTISDAFYQYRYNPTSISSTFNDKYFHYLEHVQMMADRIDKDDVEMQNAYITCLRRAHIDAAFKIVRVKRKKEFATRLSTSRKYLRRNFFPIFCDPRLNWRFRVKMLAGMLL